MKTSWTNNQDKAVLEHKKDDKDLAEELGCTEEEIWVRRGKIYEGKVAKPV